MKLRSPLLQLRNTRQQKQGRCFLPDLEVERGGPAGDAPFAAGPFPFQHDGDEEVAEPIAGDVKGQPWRRKSHLYGESLIGCLLMPGR